MGDTSRKGGGAMQTQREQTNRGYTVQKVLAQGGIPRVHRKCRQITDACGWPEDAKDMALRDAILLGLKNPKVYQKCLEEDQDSLANHRTND